MDYFTKIKLLVDDCHHVYIRGKVCISMDYGNHISYLFMMVCHHFHVIIACHSWLTGV